MMELGRIRVLIRAALRAGLLTGGAMDAVISKNQREDTTGFDNGSVHDDGGEGGDRG
jgi:hypothetical protein